MKKCNYPIELIENGIKKALSFNRSDLLKPRDKTCIDFKNNITYVSAYNPNYTCDAYNVKQTLKNLQSNKHTRNIFYDKKLIFSQRQPPNLKNILTRARLVRNEDGSGVSKCLRPRCKICLFLITGNKYYFKHVDFNLKITQGMTCDTLNCIYVLECAS